MYWKDRAHAGQLLAEHLVPRAATWQQPLVLGIPRGGVVVAYPIARALNCPLDVIVTKKIGFPGQPELAIGAVTAAGQVVLDPRLAQYREAEKLRQYAWHEAQAMFAECRRRQQRFRGDRPELNVQDREVVVVDDGIATGLTTLAAVRQLRQEGPRLLVLAVPVIPARHVPQFRDEVDQLVYLHAPADMGSVGQFYLDFNQTEDPEVLDLLQRASVPA